MKSKFTVGLLAAGLISFGVLAGCNPRRDSSVLKEFDFSISLSNVSKTLNKGEEAIINIDEENNDGTNRDYTYVSSDTAVAAVSTTGTVSALAKGEARITVKETISNKTKVLQLTITDATLANGGYNYASLAGEEAVKTRTEILGQLEKYAMDNHLTGITLFENGGYVKYAERVSLPTTTYITGYGFGLLSEGTIDADMANEGNPNRKRYLHSATSQDPKSINARNDTGSQVSDLEGYISSSFWGTKLNSTKDQYEWYPVLAKDTVRYDNVDYPFTRPVPVFNDQEVKPNTDPNPLGLYKTWRIYVKTGANSGLAYRYNGSSWGVNFDNRAVALEDYEFAYRLLLTGSHNLKRGPEMAGDQTYGIYGAQSYNTKTKNAGDAEALAMWNDMKNKGRLGIKTGTDPVNGDYIQLTILTAIDRFTAMYTFSSNLLTPMPEDFIRTIGAGSVKAGAQVHGTFNNNETAPTGHRDKILDYTLCLGPYMLEEWNKNQAIVFKKNANWNEPGRYNIEGVKLTVIDTSSDSTLIYKEFNKGNLDSCGIPKDFIKEEMGQPRVYKTRGDSTFKLNVNSCSQEEWNRQFGPNGKINKNSSWDVKPWMSNDNFLSGLFYSIDRKTFAENRGVQPSINYFSDAYLNDPENGKSYNDSEAHKQAVAAYETKDSTGASTYGYSRDKAILSFKAAVKELKKQGKVKDGDTITIHIKWMYQTDVKDYGEEIKGYFESAFNDPRVSDGKVTLKVTQDAVTNWQDVYNEYLMKGQFDLGFGAISGNTYNPLNFLQVLKSDNESGFTLNWGTDTSKVTTNKPLIYDDKMWSFDALWAVADHGGVVDKGENIKPVKKSFMTYTGNDFYNGATFWVPTTFFQDENNTVKFEVKRITLFVSGGASYDLDWELDEDGEIKVVIPKNAADPDDDSLPSGVNINNEIRRAFKLDDPEKDQSKPEIAYPFTVNTYYDPDKGGYWGIDVYYTISIKDQKTGEWGTPSESYVTAAKNEDAWKD